MSTSSPLPDCSAVTRFELISDISPADRFAAYGVRVQLSLQDDGRTLKVYLAAREDDTPAPGVP